MSAYDWQAMGLLLRRAARLRQMGHDSSDDPILDSVSVSDIAPKESPRCARCGILFVARPQPSANLCRRCADGILPKNLVRPLRYPRKAGQ